MTDSQMIEYLKKTAIDAAYASGKVLMRYFQKPLKIREKKGAGLVTNADVLAEKAALKILTRATPDFGIIAEESGRTESKIGRWIIDPLDGTTNFVHGFPMFCVSIAAEWKGEVVVGVIYHPPLKDLYVAIRGKGARLNGKKIKVSETKKIKDSLLTTGFTYRKDQWLQVEMQAFESLSKIARAIRRPGSAALDLAYVACGVFDGFWEQNLSPWDVAAGTLLVQEAGGKVTDFNKKKSHFEDKEIIASNPKLYSSLQKAVESKYCTLK
tara:strand:+ start:833 stop:1636 length:804 start_codon:yes stop_codon:yes gene_type:complete